ncbi:universal stress protein [Novosphingobium taihuense]|uniref:Nucleotide-binding universal stress UspA family protein n=1 Tax=Novosphingobium taihuense TaxID=260085 RepID=A0A7W7AG32_9SPHN|nr:universal stress protein [Novosphingobium taihuense]MBB4615629.1 nucleotide-binding universal stress UspA family protein [Novosphingobium taihuense]TWH79562.1 nucleotide-binding universal stress UspA family protein [Novosphingobium taihuense]
MRSILCPVEKSESLDDRVESALALARAMRGHVTFQVATPFAQMAAWEPFGGAALSAAAINEARERDEQFAAELDARLAPQDVPFDVEIDDNGRVEAAAAAARFADVLVASLDDPTLEELVLGVRSPVLAVPRGIKAPAFDQPVLIAWDGGHESANALRAALPLLAMAPAVHILTVREKSDTFPATDAACYLSRHGIHAEVHEQERNGSIAFTIEECARQLGVGLIVMGLFGHSRLRELLMGGVSREMLDRSQIPLLLAH